jgi:hypothetical protein
MRIVFPSEYLRAADLQGQRAHVKISHVEKKNVGDEDKYVVFFKGKDKGLVLNKTNANTIIGAYGDESKDWEDGELVLFETIVEYQGQRKPAIRCLVPPRKSQTPPAEGDPDDEIPF